MTPEAAASEVSALRRSLDAAIACYIAGRHEEAARIFSDVLPCLASPVMAEAWSFYAECLVHLGRLEEAEKALLEAVRLGPDEWKPWMSLGEVYVSLDRPGRARDALLRATQLNDGDAQLWSNFGVVERRLGRPQAALACYQRAIAADPNFPPAWRNLGNVRLDAGAVDEAIHCYERLVELRPSNAGDWSTLGCAYVRAKRPDDARKTFERAVELDPDDVDATYNLMMSYCDAGDGRARTWYRRLKTLSVASAREFAETAARGMGISLEALDANLCTEPETSA
jgi:Flp pilus assembly protein TadD